MKTINIKNLNWDKLKWFYLMAQFPSLNYAAKKLGTTQSQLSRILSDLEHRIDRKLIKRQSRGIVLLQEGQELLKILSNFFQEFTFHEIHRLERYGRVQGQLRVSISPVWPISEFIRKSSSFLKQYSDLQFSLIHPQNFIETFDQQIDCSIQEYDDSRQDEWIQHPLTTLKYGLYVSKTYFDQQGPLDQKEKIEKHPKLILKTPSHPCLGWPDEILKEESSQVHEFLTAQEVLWATQQGLGVAALAHCQVRDDPDLIALPIDLKKQEIHLYYTYPNRHESLKKTTLYVDFLRQGFEQDLD